MTFKVYTKTGDKGTTALIGGRRVGKDHIRIEAYGTIDELNAAIGVVNAHCTDIPKSKQLLAIQDRLFVIGSMLATDPDKKVKMSLPLITNEDVDTLEKAIDDMEEGLPPLKNFILPGGNLIAAHTHMARTICRRAERIIVHIDNEDSTIDDLVLQYLNRLSDYLFVLSRHFIHQANDTEIEWKPREQ